MASTQTAAKSKTTAPKSTPAPRNRKPAAKASNTQVQHGPDITGEQREAERRDGDRRTQADKAMQFSTQQMTTPVVQVPKLSAPPAVTAELQEMIDKLCASGLQVSIPGVTTPQGGTKQAKAPRPVKDVQGGVTRPGENTKCGMIWAACDRISAQRNGPAAIADLKLDSTVGHMNDHTLKTQYARWRSFNGITGRHVVQPPATPPVAAQ